MAFVFCKKKSLVLWEKMEYKRIMSGYPISALFVQLYLFVLPSKTGPDVMKPDFHAHEVSRKIS